MKYNIDFEIAAFIISFLTLAYYLASPKLKNRLSYLFFAIGIIATVVPVLNITALISDGVGQDPFIYSVNIFYRLIVKRNVAFVKRGATIVSETQVCKFKCTVCK